MVDKNSEQYLRSTVDSYCYEASDGSLKYKKDIRVSGNNAYMVSILTNDL